MRRLLVIGMLLGFALSAPRVATAQTAAGDSRGTSALVPQKGWFDVNAADASAGISYLDLSSLPGVPVWGFSVKAKSSEGIAALLSSATVAPGFEGQFYAGPKVGKKSKGLILARFSYSTEATTLLIPSATFSDQIVKATFHGHDVGMVFQSPIQDLKLILGVAAGVRRIHNYADLTLVTLRDEHVVGTTPDGKTRTETKETKARTGDYLQDSNALYFDSDVIRQIGSTAYSLAGRLRVLGQVPAAMQGTTLGFDFGAGTDDDPYSRRFVIGFDIEDVFGQRPEAPRLTKRIRLTLSASASLASLWWVK